MIDPERMKNYVIIGAYHIENGVHDYADWSQKMIKDLGDKIEPRLQEIWDHIKGNEKYKPLFEEEDVPTEKVTEKLTEPTKKREEKISRKRNMRKETIKNFVFVFFLMLCLVSLLYPPYIDGDIARPSGEGYRYIRPEYVRKFLLFHHTDYSGYDYPERINVIQLGCELSASLILFFLINTILDIKFKHKGKE
ncbi:hypothetical protein [Clostridium sp.]|uniref:hypothetical protein n=1 Tax=Clostridium sp. TaxID=1506 RepID=UPI0028484B7A|nr:hypothetical protein [Clostridium sp.]MDR3594292.1 hypothetical protein [Clostridium sp.]